MWYPLIVGVIGFCSYRYLKNKKQNEPSKSNYKLIFLPSIIGGLCCVLLFIPPMVFFSILEANNSAQEVLIEQKISPNGMKAATVYHGYAGLVDADEKIMVRINFCWFPLLEREVYYQLSPISCSDDCIQWVDNHSIMIVGVTNSIETNGIGVSLPLWLIFILLSINIL